MRSIRSTFHAGSCLSLLLLALLTPVESVARGFLCEGPQVFVLTQEPDRTVLELRWDLRPPRVYRPEKFAIALPSDLLPNVNILEIDTVPLDTPTPVISGGLFEMGPPQRARGQWIRSVRASPIRNAATGAAEQVERVVVEFLHPVPAGFAAAVARAERPLPGEPLARPGSGIDELVASSVVNVDVARVFGRARSLARRAPSGPIEDVFARSARWLRVEVADTGVLRLDYSTLRSALGADVDLVQTQSLRLFGAPVRQQPEFPSDAASSWRAEVGLLERPLFVRAAGATFAPGDEIFAYLPGADGWTDRFDAAAKPLDQEDHRGAGRLAYWLTWDEVGGVDGAFGAAPRRMGTLDGDPTGATVQRTDARVRTHFEQNSLPGFGVVADDWMWRSRVSIGNSESFRFQLRGVVTDSVAWIESEPGMEQTRSAFDTLRVRYELNGVDLGTAQWDRQRRFDLGQPPYRYGTGAAVLTAGDNRLTFTNVTVLHPIFSDPNSSYMFVDAFDVSWRRDLVWRDEAMEWLVPAAEASTGKWAFRLSDPAGAQGDLDAMLVFDVTDPWDPRRVVGAQLSGDETRLEVGIEVQAGERRVFAAVTPATAERPATIERRRPRLLRAEVSDGVGGAGVGWDMVILYPSEFRSAAERLEQLRRQNLPGRSAPRVTTVDVQDVYDQFGHGTKDPLALRNYLKFLYEVDPRLEFVLLMGDANRDARGYLPNPVDDPLPTWIVDFFPRGVDYSSSLISFANDDVLVSFDDPPFLSVLGYGLDLPDLAVGRLPARTPSEAEFLAQRVIDYETAPAPGPWRNLVLLAADDEVGQGPQDYRESEHILEAECVAENATPPGLDFDKLYLTEFPTPPGDLAKPASRIAMRQRWSEGRLIVHYVGHGAPEQMADEVLFRIEDVATLTNGDRLPLFLAFSCDVSIFDDGAKRSMSEALVSQPGGGAIATIAASQVTYSLSNEELTEAFYSQLFPDPERPGRPAVRVARSAPLGRALLQAKWSVPGAQNADGFDLRNNAKYVLLGDPALRLQTPTESVALGGTLSEVIRSGREQSIEAMIEDVFAGSGRWYLEAKESADSVVYVMDKQRPGSPVVLPPGDLPYVLDGNAFFRGTGNFTGGEFTAELRAPAVMRFGAAGRVRVIMESGVEQYLGVADSLDVVRAALDSDDREGPSIELAFEGDARRVQPGSVLVARLDDPSGINVLRDTPASSILLEFDDSGITTDVTDRFELDADTYTAGRLDVPLPEDIAPGEHVLVLTASDMLSNVGSARLTFEVVASGATDIGAHAPVPNPFFDSTNFVVEVVAPQGLGCEVEIDVRALDGSPVRRLRTSIAGGGGRVSLPWDGRDHRGDDIANGTYLYVLRVTFDTEPARVETSTGRVVLMR